MATETGLPIIPPKQPPSPDYMLELLAPTLYEMVVMEQLLEKSDHGE